MGGCFWDNRPGLWISGEKSGLKGLFLQIDECVEKNRTFVTCKTGDARYY